MDNRTLRQLAFLTVAAISTLFITKLVEMPLPTPSTHQYLSPQDLQGSSVVVGEQTYVLNFSQHNELIEYLNQARPMATEIPTPTPLPFRQILLYPFRSAPIEITPIANEKGSLIFSVPRWNQQPLRDNSSGKLLQLIQQTFDPQ